MNNGLSDKLKAAFPDIKPVQRPLVTDQEIKNPVPLLGGPPRKIYIYAFNFI
jgi:hypothetical protein